MSSPWRASASAVTHSKLLLVATTSIIIGSASASASATSSASASASASASYFTSASTSTSTSTSTSPFSVLSSSFLSLLDNSSSSGSATDHLLSSSDEKLIDRITDVTCVSSMVGAVIIIATLATQRCMSSVQKLVLCLSVCDFFTGGAYLLSNESNIMCSIQAIAGIFFPVSSFLYSAAIALLIYVTLRAGTGSWLDLSLESRNRFVWYSHVVCLIIPAGICLAVGLANAYGRAAGFGSDICWIKEGEADYWRLIAGKLVEWWCCVFVLAIYLLSVIYISMRTGGNVNPMRSETSRRLLFIPVVFIALRLPSTIRTFHDWLYGPQRLMWLSIAQAMGDPGQGVANCLCFALCKTDVRRQYARTCRMMLHSACPQSCPYDPKDYPSTTGELHEDNMDGDLYPDNDDIDHVDPDAREYNPSPIDSHMEHASTMHSFDADSIRDVRTTPIDIQSHTDTSRSSAYNDDYVDHSPIDVGTAGSLNVRDPSTQGRESRSISPVVPSNVPSLLSPSSRRVASRTPSRSISPSPPPSGSNTARFSFRADPLVTTAMTEQQLTEPLLR